jgi:2-polyprenyl-6-methoxyphenol hydroxylase-like FAD-dependent oxidoreductase
MGVADAIERVGYHMRELRIVDESGRRVAGFGTRVFRALTGGRFVTLGRSDLSRLLFDKVSDVTETILGDEILPLQEHPDAVEVQFRSGQTRRFGLVIGADGLHSNVRRLMFGSQDRFETHLGPLRRLRAYGLLPRETYNVPPFRRSHFLAVIGAGRRGLAGRQMK